MWGSRSGLKCTESTYQRRDETWADGRRHGAGSGAKRRFADEAPWRGVSTIDVSLSEWDRQDGHLFVGRGQFQP